MTKSTWDNRIPVNAAKRAARVALKETGSIIGDAAQSITPEDLGDLEMSMEVVIDNNALQANINFYSRNGRYAIPQHERLDYNHKPGKQAKYLQQPFEQLAPALLPSVLGDEVGKVL